jgi:hypothetical protein
MTTSFDCAPIVLLRQPKGFAQTTTPPVVSIS